MASSEEEGEEYYDMFQDNSEVEETTEEVGTTSGEEDKEESFGESETHNGKNVMDETTKRLELSKSVRLIEHPEEDDQDLLPECRENYDQEEKRQEQEASQGIPWYKRTTACNSELRSKYLMKKDEFAAEQRSFLLEHPELRALLSDYVQAVLLRKPTNLIPFTHHFFESFLKFRAEEHEELAVSEESTYTISSGSSESSFEDRGEWGGEDAGEDGYPPLYRMSPLLDMDGLERVDLDSSSHPTKPIKGSDIEGDKHDQTHVIETEGESEGPSTHPKLSLDEEKAQHEEEHARI